MCDLTQLSPKELITTHENRIQTGCKYAELDEVEMKKWSESVAATHVEIRRRLTQGDKAREMRGKLRYIQVADTGDNLYCKFEDAKLHDFLGLLPEQEVLEFAELTGNIAELVVE